jgi:hypothetical protein
VEPSSSSVPAAPAVPAAAGYAQNAQQDEEYSAVDQGGFGDDVNDELTVCTDQTTVVASNISRLVTVRMWRIQPGFSLSSLPSSKRRREKLESQQNLYCLILTIRSFYFAHSSSHPVVSKHGRSKQQQSRLAVPKQHQWYVIGFLFWNEFRSETNTVVLCFNAPVD